MSLCVELELNNTGQIKGKMSKNQMLMLVNLSNFD